MVIDSRAICLKVRGRSDRRGKLLACWPSHAVSILTSFVPQESHIGHIGTIGHPQKNKVGRLLKDDQEICSSHGFRMTSVWGA